MENTSCVVSETAWCCCTGALWLAVRLSTQVYEMKRFQIVIPFHIYIFYNTPMELKTPSNMQVHQIIHSEDFSAKGLSY